MINSEHQEVDHNLVNSHKSSVDFTITLLGCQNVGKTSIVKRFVSNKYEKDQGPTLGVECFEAKVEVKNKTLLTNIFDPSGQPKYRALQIDYLKKSDSVLLVYDITERKSFIELEKVMLDVTKYCGKNILIHVVGNKLDLNGKRQVTLDEGKQFAEGIGAKFIESSVVNPTNIATIFQTVVQWSQIKIFPSSVPSKTQNLLVKLDMADDLNKKTVKKQEKQIQISGTQSAIQLNSSKISRVASQVIGKETDPLPASQEEYFEKLIRKNNLQLKQKNIAEKIILRGEEVVFTKIHQNALNVKDHKVDLDVSFQEDTKQTKQIEALMKAKKTKEMENLCKEISHNLLAVDEHIASLKIDQIEEIKQAQTVKKNLTSKLIDLQQSLSLLRCEELLSYHGNFQTTKAQYQNLDQSIMFKQNISQICQSDQQEDIIKKIIQEKHGADKKRAAKVKLHEEQIKKEELNLEQMNHKIQQEKNNKKREKIVGLIKEQEERDAKRKLDHIEQQIKVKELLHKKQLPDIKEAELNVIKQNDLEIRKETLKKLRDIHQPLRKDVLDERAQQYDKVKSDYEAKRKMKLETRAKSSFHASYEGEYYTKAKEETKHNNNYREDQITEVKEKVKAVKLYNAAIKEDHLPQIDEAKTQELEAIQKKLLHNPNFKDYIEVSRSVMMKGVFFDKSGKVRKNEENSKHYDELMEYQSEQEEPRSKGNKYLQKSGRRVKKIKPLDTQEDSHLTNGGDKGQEETQSENKGLRSNKTMKGDLKRIDYLKEVHMQLNLQRKDIHHEWEKIANKKNISSVERDEQLIIQANQIEIEAKKKQQILKARSNMDRDLLKEENEVDSLFFSSIQAKLLVLDKNKFIPEYKKPIRST